MLTYMEERCQGSDLVFAAGKGLEQWSQDDLVGKPKEGGHYCLSVLV